MTQIRPIFGNEAETFLRLLCEVFELDYNRAHGVFFNEPLFDLQSKWALFDGGRMVSILTTVPLHFGWGDAIGIAGVATMPSERRKGRAGALVRLVVQDAFDRGCRSAYLFARQTGAYERVGFQVIDRVVRAPLICRPAGVSDDVLENDEVRRIYDAWAAADPRRLRRDERRWSYWSWSLRLAVRNGCGYVCQEGLTVKEAVNLEPDDWCVPKGTEWFGLESVARELNIRTGEGQRELDLMAIGERHLPVMFMTDQF